MTQSALTRYTDWFESLTPESLAAIDEYFSSEAHFVDPFNDVVGLVAIEAIFRHMFATLDAPHFTVNRATLSDDGRYAMLLWQFRFSRGGRVMHISGMSDVEFAPNGKVLSHIDHWDPARQVYEQIPVLGSLFRMLRRLLEA